jgi:hypothetical protein
MSLQWELMMQRLIVPQAGDEPASVMQWRDNKSVSDRTGMIDGQTIVPGIALPSCNCAYGM